MIDYQIDPVTCPTCGQKQDGMTPVGHADRPGPGAAALCANCGNWNIVTDGLGLRAATPGELREMFGQEDVRLLDRAWREVVGGS